MLERIDKRLAAILAILLDQHLRSTDLAKPRPRSIDRLLTDVGLSGVEIGRLLGKSPQAVSQALAKNTVPRRTAPRKSASTSKAVGAKKTARPGRSASRGRSAGDR